MTAVQMNALRDIRDHNLSMHYLYITQASESGCQIVMFPELSVTAHFADESVVQYAESMDGNLAHKM